MASDDPRALNQHVEDLALVVDGTPEIHPLVGDLDHHPVHVRMPSVAWRSNAPRGEQLDNVGGHIRDAASALCH
jgi:hypothetical protein